MKNEIYQFIDNIQQATNDIDSSDLGDISSNAHYALELTHSLSSYATSILEESDNRLNLFISAFGDVSENGTRKVVTINICLASAFCNLDEDDKIQVVSVLDTEPLGVGGSTGGAITNIADTFKNDVQFTFFDSGNITIADIQEFTLLLDKHRIG